MFLTLSGLLGGAIGTGIVLRMVQGGFIDVMLLAMRLVKAATRFRV